MTAVCHRTWRPGDPHWGGAGHRTARRQPQTSPESHLVPDAERSFHLFSGSDAYVRDLSPAQMEGVPLSGQAWRAPRVALLRPSRPHSNNNSCRNVTPKQQQSPRLDARDADGKQGPLRTKPGVPTSLRHSTRTSSQLPTPRRHTGLSPSDLIHTSLVPSPAARIPVGITLLPIGQWCR